MDDLEILKAISNAFTSRGMYLGVYGMGRGPFMCEETAQQLAEQYKRLSSQKLYPTEQGYSIVKARLDALQESYDIVNKHLALCLISKDSFLRTFASTIKRDSSAKRYSP